MDDKLSSVIADSTSSEEKTNVEEVAETGVIKSKKLQLKKFFSIAWIAVAAIVVICTAISLPQYLTYRKGQATAIELTIESSSSFNEYKYGDYTQAAKAKGLYNAYQRSNMISADFSLGDLLRTLGYHFPSHSSRVSGSYYLKYAGIIEWYLHREVIMLVGIGILLVLVGFSNLYYITDKHSVVIEKDSITATNYFGKKLQFMTRDIKTVRATVPKGFSIRGNGIKYGIRLLQNADELKDNILEYLAAHADETPVVNTIIQSNSTADEIKKYKELLDTGVITQDEFDAKKKQLLGL